MVVAMVIAAPVVVVEVLSRLHSIGIAFLPRVCSVGPPVLTVALPFRYLALPVFAGVGSVTLTIPCVVLPVAAGVGSIILPPAAGIGPIILPPRSIGLLSGTSIRTGALT
jgi:hypothetical protein